MEDAACRSAPAAPLVGAGTSKQKNRKGGRESHLKLSHALAYLHNPPSQSHHKKVNLCCAISHNSKML
jgi:hypothetical protein